jgi:hypothetical protein
MVALAQSASRVDSVVGGEKEDWLELQEAHGWRLMKAMGRL